MASITQTDPDHLPEGVHLHTWTLTTADHTGDALEFPGAGDKTIQFSGTWDGATAQLEGSNDGTTYALIVNPATGAAIEATTDATGLSAVLECPRYIRPRLTTTGTDATVVARLLSRKG